jgi:two-component system nitrate/nitrite response regulator NarL
VRTIVEGSRENRLGEVSMNAFAHVVATEQEAAPRAAVRAADPLRRRQLARALRPVDEAAADVLIIDLPRGEALPQDAGAFDGGVLVLSDDPRVAADKNLAGVLPRTAGEAQIRAAVAAVAEGLFVRTPGAPETVSFAAPAFAPSEAPRSLLTPRELEILAQVGQGLSNKAIARRLNISGHTVKYHLEAIFAKLGVRSRVDAVTRGLRQGLLEV